ncbi:hypothetical protein [Sphingomonas sp.]|uniref:hypothetical protein n=1 Tax=Sphingomonas sp. TaxID=28214 RepID=UPI002C92DA29|nr:hypothetical protein [Sphingomonas sp.]HTG39786.1 hypothetical protein [Sphingomonas sp.]
MSWSLLAGLTVGMIALGLVARWSRLAELRLTDPDNAMAIAEARLVGFHARQALPGGNGEGALVAGNGTLALLKRRGARVDALRLVPPLSLVPAVEGVGVASGDARMGQVALFGVTDDQVRALETLAQRPTVH